MGAADLAAAFALEDDFRFEVSFPMGQQVGLLGETLVANVADVRLFTRMHPHVPLPVLLVAEALRAHLALEVLLDQRSPVGGMALQVRNQVALLGERLGAQLAAKLVPDALEAVRRQAVRHGEALEAELTLVRFDLGVDNLTVRP